MNKHSMIFIGLDTHKEFHEVAYCEEQRGATPVHYGRIPSSKVSVKKLLRQFESKYPGATLHVVYEAGPCGYWIYRLITSLIVAMCRAFSYTQSLERIKTDRRDALKFVKLLVKDLTPIYVPEPEDEAVAIYPAPENAMKDLKEVYQLKALLLATTFVMKALPTGQEAPSLAH